MDPQVEKYLKDLQERRANVEDRLRDREAKRQESNEIFVESVKKELEFLDKNKIKYELRNKNFLKETQATVEDYKAELATAYLKDQELLAYRRKLDNFIQKNYPKIVNQLKAKLFRDHEDISKKLRQFKETGNADMIKLNSDIRNLSNEVLAKRHELLEEESRRIRGEGALRSYMYPTNIYNRGSAGGEESRRPDEGYGSSGGMGGLTRAAAGGNLEKDRSSAVPGGILKGNKSNEGLGGGAAKTVSVMDQKANNNAVNIVNNAGQGLAKGAALKKTANTKANDIFKADVNDVEDFDL